MRVGRVDKRFDDFPVYFNYSFGGETLGRAYSRGVLSRLLVLIVPFETGDGA